APPRVVPGAVLRGMVEEVFAVLDLKQRAPSPPVQSAARGQERVADRLGFEPARAEPPLEPVLGVDSCGRWVEGMAHLVRARRHDPSGRCRKAGLANAPTGLPSHTRRTAGPASPGAPG